MPKSVVYLPPSSMTSRIEFYLPSKDRYGRSLAARERHRLVRAVMNFMLVELGGGTQQQAVGSFLNAKDQVTTEEVTICFSYCTKEGLQANERNINQLANAMAIEFRQDALAVVLNGRMLFFTPTDEYKRRYERYCTGIARRKSDPFGYHKYLAQELYTRNSLPRMLPATE